MDSVYYGETTLSLTFAFRPCTPPLFSFAPPPPPSPHETAALPTQQQLTPSPPPPPLSSYSRKRPRPLADIDGLGFDIRDYTKKRRLRLKLITSRLSKPFAIPPTNILERGNCPRVALLAKRMAAAAGGPRRNNVMCKAAILNRMRRDAMAAREARDRQVEIARREFRERLALAVASYGGVRRRLRRPVHRRGDASVTTTVTTMMMLQNTCRGKDPYDDLLGFRRLPSPPSETVLNQQRRGVGLNIHCC